ncbi:hypothetical protein KSZ_76430 [Dictyobacter formicarum]|uniref:Uncharacterized protein n=1 Tax=Dictyobacter formicarum TaxID=2778368 RepID=A0ABQ3VTM9_9CHLR|nr:hypothetical protein KSZ_76430 [Dictyobacter formicarum]
MARKKVPYPEKQKVIFLNFSDDIFKLPDHRAFIVRKTYSIRLFNYPLVKNLIFFIRNRYTN